MEQLAVSRREAAKMLGVSAATIDRMVRAGKIKRVYLAPRTPRFYVRDIERLMAGEEPGEIQRLVGSENGGGFTNEPIN